MKNALFAGSFDPFTIGHEYIVNKALLLFDKIIIGIGDNSSKSCMLSLENREKIIKKGFYNNPKIEIVNYSGLTVDFCKKHNCNFILRGLRNSIDLEYEKNIAYTNKLLENGIETIFILSLPEHSFISSSIVREIVKYKGDLTGLLPANISSEEFYSLLY